MNRRLHGVLMVLFGLCWTVAMLPAQSNERIDEVLSQENAQVGHAAYLVLSAGGLVSDETSPQEAARLAMERGHIESGKTAEAGITFGEYSYLLMTVFDVPGGVMYRLFPGPRYAAREVRYRQWSGTNRAPSDVLSGDAAVRILSLFLNDREVM